jgi:transcriptional regulator with XRE-family HTH domain
MTLQTAGQLELQGMRLKRARVTLGLTQKQLARRVSELTGEVISHNIISVIEKGERDIWHREMKALETILHRDAAWLSGATPDDWDRVKPGYRDRLLGLKPYPTPRPAV